MLNLKEPLGGNFCQKAFSNFNSKKTPSQKIKKSVFLKGIKFWLAIYKKNCGSTNFSLFYITGLDLFHLLTWWFMVLIKLQTWYLVVCWVVVENQRKVFCVCRIRKKKSRAAWRLWTTSTIAFVSSEASTATVEPAAVMEQQQSRQQQLHQQQHQSSHHRPRSSQSGSFLQFDNRPCSPSTCRVSDCWSPTSDGLDPAGLSASQQRVTPSRPLGGLEKVIEYRPVQNGHGIELRRITASKEGPVEHIQVTS